MRNDKSALSFFDNAKIILEEAKESFVKSHYHRTVRKCQESVELTLKGLLRFLDVDYPKVHDVAPLVKEVLLEKELENIENLDEIVKISGNLRITRELAFYGDEEGNIPQEIFGKEEGEKAIKDWEKVLSFVQDIYKKYGLL